MQLARPCICTFADFGMRAIRGRVLREHFLSISLSPFLVVFVAYSLSFLHLLFSCSAWLYYYYIQIHTHFLVRYYAGQGRTCTRHAQIEMDAATGLALLAQIKSRVRAL